MNYRQPFLFACLAILLAPFLFAADIQVGDSEATVRAALGNPNMTAPIGGETILFYGRGEVALVDGKVVSLDLPLIKKASAMKPASIPPADTVKVGDSQEEVLSALGKPAGSMEVGNETTLYYDRCTISFDGGKVRQVKVFSDEELRAQKQHEKHALFLRQQAAAEARQAEENQRQQEEFQRKRLEVEKQQRLAEEESRKREQLRRELARLKALQRQQEEYEANQTWQQQAALQQQIAYTESLQRQVERNIADRQTWNLRSLKSSVNPIGKFNPNSLNGTHLPGSDGGMVIGGPLNGTLLPGSKGGMIIGGPMNGPLSPGRK